MIKVIGDLIIDEFWFGTSVRSSPEAFIPVITNIIKEVRPGGAGNVFNNIKALTDAECYDDPGYVKPHKLRIFNNGVPITRVDTEQYCPITINYDFIKRGDIVILSDYNKGMLHFSLDVIKECNSKSCISIVDPKKSFDSYLNCSVIKANYKEFWDNTGLQPNERNLKYIQDRFNFHSIIVTCGENKTHVLHHNKYKTISPTKVEVVDVTGAGDVFVAALAKGLELDLDFFNAAEVASEMASLSVTKVGTYVLNSKEYEDCLYKRLL